MWAKNCAIGHILIWSLDVKGLMIPTRSSESLSDS